MTELLAPFDYGYMCKAMWVSAAVGGACAFLSVYLVLRGWSLIGDALSHSVVPGVAAAYILHLPYALGAFFSGLLAAGAMAFVRHNSRLREDVSTGVVFTTLFALGLLMASLHPTAVDTQTIVLGNILAISGEDALQAAAVTGVSLLLLCLKWRDLMMIFFDEQHAGAVGVRAGRLKLLFFALLASCTVAAMQTVGAVLVAALLITPGATAILLTDRFGRALAIAVAVGAVGSFLGAYLSYFVDGAAGGVIVATQVAIFGVVFVLAPKHGLLAMRRRRAFAAHLMDVSP